MQEAGFVRAVGEVAKRLEPRRQLIRMGRHVQGASGFILHHDVVGSAAQPACLRGIVQCVGGEQAVNLENRCRRQWLVAPTLERLHRLIIVVDHALAVIPRWPPAAQHLLGDCRGRAGTFQLRGGHCLLDLRTDQEAFLRAFVGDAVQTAQGAGALAGDRVQFFREGIRQRDAECMPVAILEWQVARRARARQLDRQPPLLAAHAVGWRQMAQMVPVLVFAAHFGADAQGQQPAKLAQMGIDQAAEKGRGDRCFHRN